MMCRCTRVSTLFLMAAVLLPMAGHAGVQHPNVARGFSPEQAYQVGDVDHVNLFNGALTITIPIGQSYPVNGRLGYQLMLSYSSKPWDWEVHCDSFGQCQNQPTPSEDSNAGLGWSLSLGELVPPGAVPRNPAPEWLYVGPDGAEHLFYDRLHASDNTVAGFFYSRDGSYLRMRHFPAKIEIHFPDGTIHTFPKAGGRVTRIRDPFGNALAVAYTANRWDLNDGHRTHKVRFASFPMDGVSRKLVTSVELAAFGGGVATYSFTYSNATSVERPCPHNESAIVGALPKTAVVRLLDSVGFPDGSFYRLTDYQKLREPAGEPNACEASGSIRRLELPTQGAIAWQYGPYRFPTGDRPGCDDDSGSGPGIGGGPSPCFPSFLQASNGVVARTMEGTGVAPSGTWSYQQRLTLPGGAAQPVESTTTVHDPLGHKTVHYFAAYAGGGTTTGASIHDYGLPFSPTRTHGTNPVRHLSKRITQSGSGQPTRSTYVRYERDVAEQPNFVEDHGKHLNLNRRLQSRRVVYHDDGNKRIDTNHTDFDGLGQYRSTTVSGTFGTGDSRTTTMSYNPGGMPGIGETWILGTFTETTQSEGGVSASQTHCFDANTGALLRQRTRRNAASNHAHDVVISLAYNAQGNVIREEFLGGDGASLSTGNDLCTIPLPAGQVDYAIEHTYAAGSRRSSVYQTAGNNDMSFKSLDLDVDTSTGLASRSRDVSQLPTDFDYDDLGRLTEIRPPDDAKTTYVYNRATGSNNLAQIRVLRTSPGGALGNLGERNIRFDAFGRPWRDSRTLPDGTFTTRTTLHNVMGWRTAASVEKSGTIASNEWTRFLDYDAFGRPGAVESPDGKQVRFRRFGDRRVERTVDIGVAGDNNGVSESPSTTTELLDHQGRLFQVIEPTGGLTATYTYDQGSRLVLARLTNAAGSSQTRAFHYDRRGFLRDEVHPESGTTVYDLYDARGHFHRRQHGGVKLDYVYDRAERLTDVIENRSPQPNRTLVERVYATSNNNADKRQGKLIEAKRHNVISNPFTGSLVTVSVTEDYFYAGRGGRVSTRDTHVSTGPLFRQRWTYDALGNVERLTYPRCQSGPCATGAGPVREQDFRYAKGWLVGIDDYADAIRYHQNGQLAEIDMANGALYSLVNDPHHMKRPANISLKQPGGNTIAFGTHTYDGAGNLVTRGRQSFLYGLLGRLRRYTQGTGAYQTYNYDAFGNLNQVYTSADNSTRTYAISASTNRLTGTMASYDGRGNLTRWGAQTYTFSPLDTLTHRDGTEQTYLYTADGERVCTATKYPNEPLREEWTLRDLDNKVLRIYETEGGAAGTWTWKKDYLYREGVLLATKTDESAPRDVQYYAPDHLGSPVLTLGSNGAVLESHFYYGFGEELSDPTGGAEKMRFTGHERDFVDAADRNDDLDYMHARYYSPMMGRFLSVDPGPVDIRSPKAWNRYAYALNNPLTFVDPTGEVVDLSALNDSEVDELLDSLNGVLGATFGVNEDKELVLISQGADASATGVDFVASLIHSKDVFTVEGVSMAEAFGGNPSGTNTIQLDFGDFAGLDHGRVDPRAFSIGTVFLHEAAHAALGLKDPKGLAKRQVAGETIDFVNQIRTERGLPTRGPAYSAVSRGPWGGKQGINFQNVDPKRPDRTFYVYFPTKPSSR